MSDKKDYVEEYVIPGEAEGQGAKELAQIPGVMKVGNEVYGPAKPKRVIQRARLIND